MTKPLNIEFDFWMEDECQLIQEIQKLKRIDIANQEEVMAAIEILEALDANLYGLLIHHEVFFDETGIGMTMDLYRQSLDSFKTHAGVDLEKSRAAYRTALRLIQLMVGLLYDGYNCIGARVPKVFRELF